MQVGDSRREGIHVPVPKGGQYVGKGMSSLEVEIRALEEALDSLRRHL